MQQTLLALLGLLIVTMLSFSQQQANIRSQQESIRTEYRQMALGVAKQTLEVIRARTFDQAIEKGAEDVEQFTGESSSDWGGKECITDGQFTNNCSAIEHFHDDKTLTMENADGTVQVQIPDHAIRFRVEVEVHYAIEEGGEIERASSGEAPTRLKEVTVRVQDCQDGTPSDGDPCDGEPLLSRPVVFSEIFGYTG
ncbi:MAG: hypothetical protein ABEL51_07730 [Salinibacter sp.]